MNLHSLSSLQGPYLFQEGEWELTVSKIIPGGGRARVELVHNKILIYAVIRTPLTFAVGDKVKANITVVESNEIKYNKVQIMSNPDRYPETEFAHCESRNDVAEDLELRHENLYKMLEKSLLPCPFCGHALAHVITGFHELVYPAAVEDEVDTQFTVVCAVGSSGCGASCGWKDSPEAAVISWNSRK